MAETFVGRRGALTQLDQLLEEARSGTPRVALVEGPAGIGKSALLRAFVASLGDDSSVTVLDASGEETERSLPYGVIDQLAQAARPLLPELPEVFAGAVGGGDPLALGAALLDVVGALQADGPAIVVVDDVQWADTPSLHALLFAFRRLRVDRVLVVLASRPEAVPMLPGALQRLLGGGGARIVLDGLDGVELAELATGMGVAPLSPAACERLRAQTDGNPLYAQALLEEVPEQVAHPSADAPLPAPRTFSAVALARLATCSADTERLVASAAVLGGRFSLALAARVAGLDDPTAGAQEAVDARLFGVDRNGRPSTFDHPLVRSAIYHGLGPSRRSELHARAADLVDEEALAVRHRAASCVGEDDDAADELEALSMREAAAAGWSAAAADLLRAADLSSTRAARERRVLQAIDCWVLGADFGEVAAHAARLDGFEDGPWLRYVRGVLLLMSGELDPAEELLRSAWATATDESDPQLAARVAAQMAIIGVAAGWGEESVEWARRAYEAPTPAVPATAQMFALALLGRFDAGLDLAAKLPDPLRFPSPDQLDSVTGRGVLRLWTDDLDGACRDLAAAVAACRQRGPFFLDIVALMYLGNAEFRRGDWSLAIAHSGLAASAAGDADLIFVAANTNAIAALPLAARGSTDEALAHVIAAQHAAAATGDVAAVLFAAAAAAHVAAAAQDHTGVVAALEPLLLRAHLVGSDEPSIMPWRDLLAEALTRLGRLDEADAVLRPMEERAAARGIPSVGGAAARARGLVLASRGENEAADASFVMARDLAARSGSQFAIALAELAHGEHLRRSGRRRLAAEVLTAARGRLRELGAAPYLNRCDDELDRCGMKRPRRGPSASPLTPQEQAIAHLVTTGATNREIAAELVLSVKTIEYHLGNIFARLGIRSRRQLAGALAALDD